MELREASAADLPALCELYNAAIPTTIGGAWAEEPETLEQRQAWFSHRHAAGDPVLVATCGGEVIGFCAWSEFRDVRQWPGYRFTVEHTIHVAASQQRTGVGRALLCQLLERASRGGIHAVIGAIDSANEGSLRFHEAMGFVEVGRLPEIGWKFGRWLDLVLVQRIVDPGRGR